MNNYSTKIQFLCEYDLMEAYKMYVVNRKSNKKDKERWEEEQKKMIFLFFLFAKDKDENMCSSSFLSMFVGSLL